MATERPGAPLTRRAFVSRLTAAGVGAAVAGAARPLAAQPAAAESRLVCVFSKHLQWLEDYEAMAAFAADVGFDGVDLTVRPGGHVPPERVEEALPRAVEAVRGAGLEVPMITTAITDPDDPTTVSILETAAALGIGTYRMGYFRYEEDAALAPQLDAVRGRLRDLAALNAEFGLHAGYQNHDGQYVGSPVWDLWYLLRDLDPRWVGCQYDIRHATVEGGRSWPLGLRLLHPYIRTTVVKDFRWAYRADGSAFVENVPLGHGVVDFPRYFELAQALGVDGPISVHFEYPLEKEGAPAGVQRLRVRELMVRDLHRLRGLLYQAGEE